MQYEDGIKTDVRNDEKRRSFNGSGFLFIVKIKIIFFFFFLNSRLEPGNQVTL